MCLDICPEVFELNGETATVKFDVVPPRYEEGDFNFYTIFV